MDYCTRCSRQIEPGKLFCNGCGIRLRPPEAAPNEPSPRQASAPPPRTRQARDLHTSAPEARPPQPPRDRPPSLWGAPRWPILTGVALVLAICGAAVAIIVTRPSAINRVTLSGNGIPVASPSASPQQQPTTQPPASGTPAERVAAQDLSQLLAQSATDRSAIVDAVNDVNACGSNLAGDAQAFQQVAASRKNLLSQLSALPDSFALPAQMLQDLSGAWQSSYQVDQDFAGWANDENSNGCTANDTSDSYYQAAMDPDNQATTDKQAFVNLWNPIASQYGRPTYQWNEL
jgi:hypothetical protein